MQGMRHGFVWAAPRCWGPGLDVLRGVGRLQCWLATSCKDFDALPFVIETYRFRSMESLREMFGDPRLLHQEKL